MVEQAQAVGVRAQVSLDQWEPRGLEPDLPRCLKQWLDRKLCPLAVEITDTETLADFIYSVGVNRLVCGHHKAGHGDL